MNVRNETIRMKSDDGSELFVRLKGSGSRNVIVPNAIYMEDELDALAVDRRLVFFDLRNRGRSGTIAGGNQLARGIHADVDDLEAVRRHIGAEKIDILGHSYLGLVVGLYAIKYPSRIDRMVQISPAAAEFSKTYAPPLSNDDGVMRQAYGALSTVTAIDPAARCKEAWNFMRPAYVADQSHVDRIARWGFCDVENERNALKHFQTSILPTLLVLKLSSEDYAKVTTPSLVIHGVKDRSAPYGGGRDWARSWPNARLVTAHTSAHVPYVEEPALTMHAIATFLSGDWPSVAEKVER